VPDMDLDLMQPNQSLAELTARVVTATSAALSERRVDLLVVQGDTTTAFAAALAAFYLKIPVAHIEAGLRSHDTKNPFPEEVNRRLASVVARIHLAPTRLARENLLDERVPSGDIAITGNTVVDSLRFLLDAPFSFEGTPVAALPLKGQRIVLVTSHRRESWGRDLESICLALKDVVEAFPDVSVVYPVHLNPNVGATVNRILAGAERIHLTTPLDYLTFVNLLKRSHLILTDSGGVQEEAPTLRKPLLLLRQVTERPEAFELGLARVVGTSREAIFRETRRLLTDSAAYDAMTKGENPYGDGRAGERIAEALCRWARGQTPLLTPDQEFVGPAAVATEPRLLATR